VGIWALGYDRGLPGYWDLLKSVFGPPRVAALTVSPEATKDLSVNVAVTATAGSRLVTEVRFGRDGRTWEPWLPLPAAVPDGSGTTVPPSFVVPIDGAGKDGPRTVWAQVRDAGGTVSKPRSARVVLDRTGPVLAAAPELWFSPTTGTWRARWKPAKDPHGPVAYRVRYSVNGAPWRVATLRTSATSIGLPLRNRSTRVAVQIRVVDGLGNWGPPSVTRR
jgi:hypothetical protein